jgi:uncharacterized membrane protein
MKTSKKIALLNRRNRIILSISIIGLLFVLTFIVFHLTPLRMLSILSDFAVHHYFLTTFFTVVVFLVSMRNYASNQDEIDDLKNEKNRLAKVKLKERRQRIQRFKNRIALKLLLLKNKVTHKEDHLIAKYSAKDVLLSQEEVMLRQQDLTHAMKLGNSFKQNVKLYYKESNLHKCVETAILFVNSEHVTIRGGVVLPIRSIYKVEM